MERLRKRFTPSGENGGGGLNIRPLLDRSLGVAACLVLGMLIAITCVDVVGRYFFDRPLTGAFELTELLLAALVFLALPLTTERREHIEVDILNLLLPPRATQWLAAFAGLFSAALLATLAWRLASHAIGAGHDGTVTNALAIPYAPFGFLASFSCLVSAFIAFLRGIIPPEDMPEATTHTPTPDAEH